jgi:hypothetical protein
MHDYLEFHFQEGFTGETVILAVDGETRVRFEARTRPQTGLAHIETLELGPGQTVTISVPDAGLRDEYQVAGGEQWVTVNMVDRALVVGRAQGRPGYV